MKRLALSLLGGFLIPFIYAIIIGSLPSSIENRTVNKLLMLPVRWPMILLERLFSIDLFLLQGGSESAILIYMIAADVLLYSFLTYLLLWRFWKRRPEAALPPEPPQFAAE